MENPIKKYINTPTKKKNTSPLLAFLWSLPVSFFLFFISMIMGTGHNTPAWLVIFSIFLLILAFLLPFIVLFSSLFNSFDTPKTSSVGQDSLASETTQDTQPQKLSIYAKVFLWIALGFLFISLTQFCLGISLLGEGTAPFSILGFIIALSIFTFIKEKPHKDETQ